MEKQCLESQDGDDLILINLLRPVLLGTSDKIAYVVHTALDMCANVLHLRLVDMK